MNKSSRHHSAGFSMIEVLVTLLLISIGILGMVALQTRTVQYTQEAVQQNTAAMLANDLVELMRAMPHGMAGFYKAQNAAFPTLPKNGCATLPTDTKEQLSCWSEKAKTALPGAEQLLTSNFYVCQTGTANSCSNSGKGIEIQLAWKVKEGTCANADAKDKSICYYRLRTQI